MANILNLMRGKQVSSSSRGEGMMERSEWLNNLTAPLYINSQEGKQTKELMLSPIGKSLRATYTQLKPLCKVFPNNIFILSDGSVTTCCNDTFGRNRFASIYDQSLADIWQSQVGKIMEDLYELPLCRECIGSEFATLVSAKSEQQSWQKLLDNAPDILTVEVMGTCNYGCCASPEIHKHRAVKPDLEKIFSQIKGLLPQIRLLCCYNYGEPLLHDGFIRFLENCRGIAGNLRISIATNGILLNEKYAKAFIENRINFVCISVHGGPGTENMLKYSKYGADYEQVLENVGRLISLRNSMRQELPKISLRAILFDWNDTDELMDKFRQDARGLGLVASSERLSDNYHWIFHGGNENKSQRFVLGSEALKQLIDNNEIWL